MASKLLSLTSAMIAASVFASSGMTSLLEVAAAPGQEDDEIVQLTVEDIQEMNDDNAIIIYNDEGYVSTIVGDVYGSPITEYSELRVIVDQLRDVLGLDEDSTIEPLVQDSYNGYTTFTFIQTDGEFEVANSTLKILIDENNYPVMIQSSLVPHLQTSFDDDEISAEEAEEVVEEAWENIGIPLTVIPGYTESCIFNLDYSQCRRCYQVYTYNPLTSQTVDMPYLVHYIDFDGSYLRYYPTNSLSSDTITEHNNVAYFENLVAEDYTFTVERNGEDFTFTVPISYNSRDGQYYLADPSRNIIFADYYDFVFGERLTFETSDSPEYWNENHVITYYNYIQSYDFYKNSFNLESPDGFGMPILILSGYCDANGTPVNNQCSMGPIDGWSVFACSDANTYAYSMDVTTHEYTHAVSAFNRQGDQYYNEYGAINEAFSDIMGNIAEMSMGETTDENWEIAETSGNTMRSMSDPNAYYQPLYVGDPFFANTVELPDSVLAGFSDNGGVHSNNSLITHLCYVLYEEGMSLDDLAIFFYQSIILHTPKADYDDLFAVFVEAALICDFEEIVPIIVEYWEDTGLFGDRTETARATSNEGFARVNVIVSPAEYSAGTIFVMVDANTGAVYYTLPMDDGTFTLSVPEGNAWGICLLVYTDASYRELAYELYLNEDLTEWTDDDDEIGVFGLESEFVLDLEANFE